MLVVDKAGVAVVDAGGVGVTCFATVASAFQKICEEMSMCGTST